MQDKQHDLPQSGNEPSGIGRRTLLTGLTGLAGAVAIASAASAQQAPTPAAPAAPAATGPMRRVAIASGFVATEAMIEAAAGDPGFVAFFAELKVQGFTAGQNVTFERHSGAQYNMVRRLQGNRYNALGVAIGNSKPDVVFAASSFIARGAGTTADAIPTVFLVGDALGTGLIANLDKPGANFTGVSATNGPAREAMRLELLREAVPAATRAAYLMKSQAISPTPYYAAQLAAVRAVAARVGATLTPAYFDDVLDDAGLDATALLRAVLEAQKGGAQGLVVAETYDQSEYSALLGNMALATKLPAIAPWRDFVLAGGLMSYGPNQVEMYKSAARQVARVLKGEKAGDIAVERPAAELVVSQRNAKHLGITLPAALVAKAKEVLPA